MPGETHSKPLQLPPSASAAERAQRRFLLLKGTSPWLQDEPRPEPIDRSKIVACPAEGCYKRFLDQSFLERHQVVHAKPARDIAAESAAAAVELIVKTITGRIASADLVVGDAVKLGALADELGVTRARIETAVTRLVREGVLGFSGIGSARRTLVI
jgi:hypothetical protein